MKNDAYFDPTGRYRYTLDRTWGDGGSRVLWVMLNPSTADAEQNDPTIRRCISFSKRWGYDGLTVVNLFAFRSTDPGRLAAEEEPIGERNDMHIQLAAISCERTIAAWGAHPFAKVRARDVRGWLGSAYCLGLTAGGAPKHPLYVPGDTLPIAFPLPMDQVAA
ncbi:MAG: DUF1643 domain-containing protein [Thermoanaerobaculia bacterium]